MFGEGINLAVEVGQKYKSGNINLQLFDRDGEL